MSVAKMKVVSIIGMMSDLDETIKICGKSQAFQPEEASHFYSEMKGFTQLNEKNPYSISKQLLKDIFDSAGLEYKPVDVSDFKVGKKEIDNYVTRFSTKFGSIVADKNEIEERIKDTKRQIDQVSHFTGQQLKLQEIFACQFIKVRFGRIPKESYLKLQSYKENPYVLFFPCTSDNTHYWGVYFAPKEQASDVDRVFAGLYFERIRIESFDGTPEERLETLKLQLADDEKKLASATKKLDAFWESNEEQCMRFYSKILEFDTYFSMKKYAYKYKHSFILIGWIPESEVNELRSDLELINSIECSVESAEDVMKHSPPVKLKNNWFSKPFEMFIEMYGLPSYNEIDPTLLVSIIFTILYGVMFGDLGQGIVLALIGYFMWRKKKMVLGKILVRCGISGAICGFFYGSVFGYEKMLNPIHQKLFGVKEKLFEVMDKENIVWILLATVAAGVFLIVLAMIVNIYSSLRRQDYESAIFGHNGFAGLTFYLALIIGSVLAVIGKSPFNVFYILGLLVLPIVLIFFKEPLGKLVKGDPNWKPEAIGDYLMQSFFEMFEVLIAYFSNTISFIRIGAYMLVHSGMMMAGMEVGKLLGRLFGGDATAVGFMVFWNILVIGLEGTLVTIQVMRLNYYEMFSRFYEGQGRPFEPVKVKNV